MSKSSNQQLQKKQQQQEEEAMTAANVEHPRGSLVIDEVFAKDNSDHGETMDTETSPSDSDHSSTLNASVSSRGSILRVATLEESLAQTDLNHENDDSNRDEASSSSHNKSVTFKEVQVREYPICPGDNPAGFVGCPLTIEWNEQFEGKLSIDDYESSRPERRRSEELRIPAMDREQMLRNSGYSRMDIQEKTRQVNIARNQRKRTNETHRLHKAQEVAERLVRGTLNATVRRQKKKEEKALVEHFRKEAAALRNQLTASRRSTWPSANGPPVAMRRGTWAPSTNQDASILTAGNNAMSNPDLMRALQDELETASDS